MDNSDYQRAYNQMRRKGGGHNDSFDDYEAERILLARYVVSQRLKRAARLDQARTLRGCEGAVQPLIRRS
ncbi:hypothetical protein ACFTAO_18775 [Paenibacillus rhizoplanae]